MRKSWSDKIIMDDRTSIWIALGSAGLQIALMYTTDMPLFSAWVAGICVVGAMHLQVKRNEHRLRLLADRLLYGHACDECITYEGQRYCFYKMRTS